MHSVHSNYLIEYEPCDASNIGPIDWMKSQIQGIYHIEIFYMHKQRRSMGDKMFCLHSFYQQLLHGETNQMVKANICKFTILLNEDKKKNSNASRKQCSKPTQT